MKDKLFYCTKTLTMDTENHPSFIKGKFYKVWKGRTGYKDHSNKKEIELIDEDKDSHQLSDWAKYFIEEEKIKSDDINRLMLKMGYQI